MAKDPAVLFYTSDFISGTITMSDEQRGKYILLLCLQHQKGFLTENDMKKICNTYDEDIYAKFEKRGDKYVNLRMDLEAEKRRNYCKSRGNNRKGSKKHNKIISKSYENHMENEDVNVNKDLNNKYNIYISTINKILNTNFRITDKIKPKIAKILNEFTVEEIELAVKNAKKDSFHAENNYKYLTSEFFTRSDKVEAWLNSKGVTQDNNQTLSGNILKNEK